MTMTLAVTGATGFVGGHVLAAAAAQGARVQALARRPQPPRDGVRWIAGSLEDRTALEALVAGSDALIHVAGVVNPTDPADFWRGNVAGTAALRAVAGGRPFVHVSSLAAREPALSRYGASKRQAEDVARGASGPLAIVRPPAVYGPGDTDLLPLFRAVRAGLVPLPAGNRAAMIYAADLGQCLVALAQDLGGACRAAGGLFEVDDGMAGYAQRDLALAIGMAMGTNPHVLPVPAAALALGALAATAAARVTGGQPRLSRDRARYLAHPDWTTDSRPLRALGLWAPATPLEAGLQQTVSWYRAAGLL
jgi:nucleoside-diphosphate-sugar epimerase